jgi:hypothetical protein
MNYAIRLQLVQYKTPTTTLYITPNGETTGVQEEAQTFYSKRDADSAAIDYRNAANQQTFSNGWGAGVRPVVSTIKVGKHAAAHSFFTNLAVLAFAFAAPVIFIAAPLMLVDHVTDGAVGRISGPDRGDIYSPQTPF